MPNWAAELYTFDCINIVLMRYSSSRNELSTIKFGNLIWHLKRTQCCACYLWKICQWHICISHQSCPRFNIHFELIWFIGEFKTPTLWVFVWWWDNETDFDGNEKAYRKNCLSKTSGKGDFIQFKLIKGKLHTIWITK